MATDYSRLEKDLADLKTKLKRDLHMHHLKRLQQKQRDLAKEVVQRKQIQNLMKQLAELESTVSVVYSPHHAIKDNEIEGYLVYLLGLKDYFAREVITKEEMIKEKEIQIKMMTRKLCSLVNVKAKLKKNAPVKTSEFARLENISNRMEQMNKRISIMRQENQEIMKNIISMRKFQKQFKKSEKDFRRRIAYFNEKSHELLEKAVSAYEEKEEFVNKCKMYQERRTQDVKKSGVIENALNLCLQKTEKNEAFAKLQDTERTDVGLAEASDMIEQGITGLEPNLEQLKDLHDTISEAAPGESPEEMEKGFDLTEDAIGMMFAYLDELLKDEQRLRAEADNLKEENKKMLNSMSKSDRKLRKEIEINQNAAADELQNAEEASKRTAELKSHMDALLEFVTHLYTMCCPDDDTIKQQPIDDTNVIDYLQKMEKHILDGLICLEYIRIKEVSGEEAALVIETEKDEDAEEQDDEKRELGVVSPRNLSSDCDLRSLKELETEKDFLGFEELKEKAVATLEEIDIENRGGEELNEETN